MAVRNEQVLGEPKQAEAGMPSRWRRLLSVPWKRRLAPFGRSGVPSFLTSISLIMVLIVCLVALGAPYLAGDPNKIGANFLRPPSTVNWMGTDELGRDIYARVIHGTRLSMLTAMLVLAFSVVLGTAVGALAALRGKWADEVLMRLTDAFFAFPYLILAITIAAILRPSYESAVIAIAMIWWPSYARLVRSMLLQLKHSEFVEAARSIGASEFRIFLRHLSPHLWGVLIIKLTSDVGAVILISASLAFLGLGAQPPTPEWGAMLADASRQGLAAWWYSFFPGIAIVFAVLGFSLLGDELQDLTTPGTGRS